MVQSQGEVKARHEAPSPNNLRHRAPRALIVACILVAAVLFVAASVVLVEVRLLGLGVEVWLAWAIVVPAALAFAGGMLYAGARPRRRQ